MARIAQTFYNNVQAYPDKVAIECDGEELTYEELGHVVRRLTHGLSSQGVERGEAMGVVAPNSIEFVALMLAAAALGIILVPLNPSLPAAAVARCLATAGVRHVAGRSMVLRELQEQRDALFSFVTGTWISLDDALPGTATIADLIVGAPAEQMARFEADEEDAFILTMTSGSTGAPKPITMNQRTKWERARAAIELYGIQAEDRVLVATPLHHSLAERLVLTAVLVGATAIVMPRYSISEWLRHVNTKRATFTIAVSSQLSQLARHLAESPETDVSSLRCLVSSSAQLLPAAKTELLDRLSRCQLHECYGTSEIAIASNLNMTRERLKLDSMGKAAPGVDIGILREDRTLAAPGEEGEIICKTPMLFAGYFNRPELTRAAMRDGYFLTGDVGMMDDEGYLYFLGRKSDIIITGGINVYAKDVESALSSHPATAECAAFATPDAGLGEVVSVAIVPRSGTDMDTKSLRHHCAKHLADFQQPRRYCVVKQLPRNATGKIQKHVLREQLDGTPT